MKLRTTLTKFFARRARLAACAIIFSTLGLGAASAQTLNWGNAVFDVSLDSDGNSIDDATFTFELGTFSSGFVPTEFNTGQWASEWTTLDSTSYNDAAEFFSASYTIDVGDASLAGEQAYIWVYNNMIGDETSEWAVITDDSSGDEWVVPTYIDPGAGGPPPGTFDWRVSTATTSLWGGLNNTAGPGEQQVVPSNYALQTFTFSAPIPEPSSAVFLSVAALGLLRRRR